MTHALCEICQATFAAGRCPRCERWACSTDLVVQASRGGYSSSAVMATFAGRPGQVVAWPAGH